MKIKTYSELILLPTYEERLEYLKCYGIIGVETFGGSRYINQYLYKHSHIWKTIRREVILRDDGCDLALPNHTILYRPTVHHIIPITREDILNNSKKIFDLDNLILCSHDTHLSIHYGKQTNSLPMERVRNDTCPWKK